MTSILEEAKSLRAHVLSSVPGSEKSGAVAPISSGAGSAAVTLNWQIREKIRKAEIFLMALRLRELNLNNGWLCCEEYFNGIFFARLAA